jgi:hypothetical protein
MKRAFIFLLIGLGLFGCVGERFVTKPWHTSPSSDPQSSTIYPFVSWSVVQQLHPGMSAADAKRLVFDLQSYNHPANAIVYSTHGGQIIEVAVKLSSDGERVEDISYKKVAKIEESDGPANRNQTSSGADSGR